MLEAVLARNDVARHLTAQLPSLRIVRLDQDMRLLPLTENVIRVMTPEPWEYPLLFDRHVPEPLAALLLEASRLGAVAYVEADFWGGDGRQACVVWEGSRIVLGPIIEEERLGPRLHEGAINRALRSVGVSVGPDALDEFDTVGLGRRRRTAEWLELAEPLG